MGVVHPRTPLSEIEHLDLLDMGNKAAGRKAKGLANLSPRPEVVMGLQPT
jgi:hypothetical protein